MHFQFLAWNAKSQLPDALHAVPKLVIGGWAWVYNTAATIRQRSKMHTDAKVLEAKPSLNWKGPLKSSQLASVPLLTSWTAPFSALSSYIWVYTPTCPVWMLAGAFRYNAANPVPTRTTAATCRSRFTRY